MYEEKRAEFEKAGRRILTLEESAKAVRFYAYNNTYSAIYGGAYVMPNEGCDLPGAGYREFSKLWGKKKPAPILAQASNGFPVEIYSREEAEAAVKASGKLKADEDLNEQDEAEAAQMKERELQRDVFNAALPVILEKEQAGDTTAAVWRWLALSFLRTAWTQISNEIARRHKLAKEGDTMKTLEAYIGSLTGHEARALIVEAVLLRNRPDHRGHSDDFLRAAEVYGLDLVAIAAEVQTSGQTKKGKGKK